MSEMLWAKGQPLDEQLHAFTVGNDPIIDLRLLPENEAKALVAALRRLKEQAERGELTITREQEDGHTALEVAGTSAGIGSVTTSDWAFLKGIPTVKIGPGDTNRSHRPNEYLLLSELEKAVEFYGRFTHTYFQMAAKEAVNV